MTIIIPRRSRGRQSAEKRAQYETEISDFAIALNEIDSTLKFEVSSRGWCYILEEHGLGKGDFDAAQRLINDCRKSGLLPISFTATDENREAVGIEYLSYPFEIDSREVWINRDDLTANQRTEMASAMHELGERKFREAEALKLYCRAREAGVKGAIDGGAMND